MTTDTSEIDVHEPVLLEPHFIRRFYRASGRLSAFRSHPAGDYDSEEWIGSTTQVFGGENDLGLSALTSGELLRDVVRRDPIGILGPQHVERFGPSTELLVKILDAGERLPVHIHPNRDFAQTHLGSVHGKAEAWIILEAPESAAIYVGFKRPLERDEILDLMERQDSEAMLSAMHRIPIQAGDAVFVPAGLPHAIGEGLLLVELQEPTDYSMLMEWAGYDLDAAKTGRLGLSTEVAVGAINPAGLPEDNVLTLVRRGEGDNRAALTPALPRSADAYFRAEHVKSGAELDPDFSIVIVVEGPLVIRTQVGSSREYQKGQAVMIPFSAGQCTFSGEGSAIRCRPPAPERSRLAWK
ncbi:mannose-6-phosphate isomerase [Arthrobacter sp. Hiyo4]|nr:mannose-6-phosphate isomerase [Arthrobacter sp. Hiyo4]